MDPTGDNDILQHQFRQSMIINLFGSIVEPPKPSDAEYLDILADSVCLCVYICITKCDCSIVKLHCVLWINTLDIKVLASYVLYACIRS